MPSTDGTGRDPVELSLRDAALMLGLSEPALRERVSRKTKRGRRRGCVEFDGHRFRTRDGRWRVQKGSTLETLLLQVRSRAPSAVPRSHSR